MLTTRIGSTTIVTANTEPQLKSKTWAELGKWNTLAINGHWFDYQALSLRPAPWFAEAVKRDLKIDTGYYYAQALTWSEENPDAFAGAHNPLGIFVLFDEASGIDSKIWSVTEGFFTEPVLHRYWMVFSNGRRNSGAFYDIFHPAHRPPMCGRSATWTAARSKAPTRRCIRRSSTSMAPTRTKRGWRCMGNSRSRVTHSSSPTALADEARRRELRADPGAPLIMGIDVARLGRDSTVIRFRQGWDARSIRPIKLHGMTMDGRKTSSRTSSTNITRTACASTPATTAPG
jgi:hypothetical protein